MRHMENLKETLCADIDELAKKSKLTSSDVETLYKLTDIVKNLDKIKMLEDEGYSHGGMWEARIDGAYGMGNSYDGSYARNRDARGRYSSRGNDGGGRGGNRGGGSYSYGDAKEDMLDQLEDMMNNSENERIKNVIKRCADSIKNI